MSKIERLKKQYPELDINLMDIIASVDPSQTKKYVEFLIKQINRGYTQSEDKKKLDLSLIANQIFGYENVNLIHSFEDHYKNNRIRIKDISLYHTLDDIRVQVEEANEIVKLKELEKQTIKLFDNKEWLVVIPTSHESSQLYAHNTKWCITMKSYWNDYKKHSRIIYIINKKTDEKYAISKRMNNNDTSPTIQGWDAKDNEVSPFMWEFTDEIWKVLRNDLKKTKLQHELDEIETGYIRINAKGDVVKLEESTLPAIEWFYKKYHNDLQEPFLSQVVERGKKLRNEETTKRNVTKATSKLSSDEIEELYNYVVTDKSDPAKVWSRMEDYGFTKYYGEDFTSQFIEKLLDDAQYGKRKM